MSRNPFSPPRLRPAQVAVAAVLVGVLALASCVVARADQPPGVEVHYSPGENLEHIDVGLIASARFSIDAAIYVLSDWAIIDALDKAAGRGVKVRIIIDRTQRHAWDRLGALAATGAIRTKRSNVYMHLKSMLIDGDTLRDGSANYSASGLKAQDNSLLIVRSPVAAAAFSREFVRMWSAGEPVAQAPEAGR